jgi:dipeptidyl aminopeptidase/acylaminoacyl peptidase
MKQYTYLHMPLAFIAVLGFLAYLLACRPSWSPDGSKVLFPYVSEEKGKAGVVLYDRDLKKATSIFSTPFDDGPGVQAQWDKRGDTAIVICFGAANQSDDSLQVHLLPLQADAPKKLYRVRTESDFLGAPFPQVGSHLFLHGDDLIRLNLDDGTVKRVSLVKDRQILLVQHDQGIFFLSEKPRPQNLDVEDADGESERDGDDDEDASNATENGDAQPVAEQEQAGPGNGASEYEVGSLDPESLRLDAFATLRLEKDEGILPHFAVSPDGSSLAFMCQKGRQFRLLLVRDKKTQESLPLKLSTQRHAFGNLQWSPDGKTIYAVAGEKVQDKAGINIGVAEIDLKKGVTKVVPLLQGRESDPDAGLGGFQIALSPDGKTVAASMGFLDMGVGDNFLFLVDLGSPDRKVTKIPLPFGADGED